MSLILSKKTYQKYVFPGCRDIAFKYLVCPRCGFRKGFYLSSFSNCLICSKCFYFDEARIFLFSKL